MARVKAVYSNRREQARFKTTFVHRHKDHYFFLFDYFDLRYQFVLASSVSYIYVMVFEEPYSMLAYFKERFDAHLKHMADSCKDFQQLRECSRMLGEAHLYQNFDAKRKELTQAYNEGCSIIQAMDPLISMGRLEQFVRDDGVIGINREQSPEKGDCIRLYGQDSRESELTRNELKLRLNMLRNIVIMNEFNKNSRFHLYLVWNLLAYLREPEYSREG